jgi:hypothetical protein
MSNNLTFDKMLEMEGPLTVERFVKINWVREIVLLLATRAKIC